MRPHLKPRAGKGVTQQAVSILVFVAAAAWLVVTLVTAGSHKYEPSHIITHALGDNTIQVKEASLDALGTLGLAQLQDEAAAYTALSGAAAAHRHQETRNSVDSAIVAQPASPPPPSPDADTCHALHHADYAGDVVKWGTGNHQDSAGGCCRACQETAGCNIWVWCGELGGCGPDRPHKECWLKRQHPMNLLDIKGQVHAALPWTSGALYSDSAYQQARGAEAARLKALKEDPSLPLVWLDVAIKGEHIGRVVIALFSKESPRAAENFRALCTGEKGTVPPGREGAGLQYHIKGKSFYRIIDHFIDQTGAGTDSIYGGYFKDDPGGLKLKHDRKGLLSMANAGQDMNTSHFSILMAAAPHLDGKYTIFGEVVEGLEVAEKVNALSRGHHDNHVGIEAGAVISDSGQLRCGEPCGLPAA